MKSDLIWKQFEKRIKHDADHMPTVVCIRIRDDIRYIAGKVIRCKSEFDFAGSISGQAIFFDAKTTHEDRWNLKQYVFRTSGGVNKIHQWLALKESYEKGALAGYLVWFLNQKRIVWASVPCVLGIVERDEKYLVPETLGALSMPDDQPINFVKINEESFVTKDQ